MSFAVICPDGVDRLKVRWPTREAAEFDARYFSNRRTCWDWCPSSAHQPWDPDACPGGAHTVAGGDEPEPLTAWAVDL